MPATDDRKGNAVADDIAMVKTESPAVTAAPISISERDSKRLLLKIDICLLPVMAISYMFQYLDKSALSLSAILNLPEDLHLSGSQYSWANSIYYFGYLAFSYPAAALMVRLPTGKVIAASIFIWGVILILTPVCFNGAGLIANRFFLGAAEAAIAPGLSIVISMWYKRREQPIRHAAWFLGNTFAGMVGSLLGYGIGHLQSIAPWKAVFAIFGGVTIAWGIATIILIPDVPGTAVFLSKHDRHMATMRVQENMTGIKNSEFKWKQVWEALLDVKSWFLALMMLCSTIPNGGVSSFGPLVIKGMGFTTFSALLLNVLAYAFQAVYVIVATGASTLFPNARTLSLAWGYLLSLTGALMINLLDFDKRWARFFGYCLLLGYTSGFPLVMSMVTSNSGGFTKKMTVSSMVFISYCAGNIIGPQLFVEKQAPTYQSGFLAVLICFCIGLALALVFRLYLIWENRRRDRLAANAGVTVQHADANIVNELDLTDKEIPEFRYVY